MRGTRAIAAAAVVVVVVLLVAAAAAAVAGMASVRVRQVFGGVAFLECEQSEMGLRW